MAEKQTENQRQKPEQQDQTDVSLAVLAQQIRKGGAIEGSTMLEDWERRREKGEPLSEKDIEDRIEQIEANMDKLQYSSALERTMYYTVLERMRLRLNMRQGRIDLTNSQDQHDVEVLKDLNRRITYAQYEETAVDEILDAAEEYEQYRSEFGLDRPAVEGGILRNAVLETRLREQFVTLNALLPKMAEMRRLRHYEFRLSQKPDDPALQEQVDQIRKNIPSKFQGKSKEYYDVLEQELRTNLGTSSQEVRDRKLTTPVVHELHRETIQRHFDSVLERRKELVGKTGLGLEQQKEELKDEHCRLLDHALNYNIQSVSRLTTTISLLSREGHFGQPVEDPAQAKEADRDYGLLGNRGAIAGERDRKITDFESYISHFRKDVLREDRRVDVPIVGSVPLDPALIMEDLMTTHVIPAKLKLVEPFARGATAPWVFVDAITNAVGLNLNIRERRTQAILQPIYERLGLPENYSDLAPDEQAKARNSPEVQKRIQSVKSIIDEFRATEGKVLQDIEEDLALIRQLIALKSPDKLVVSKEPVVFEKMPDIQSLSTDEEFAGAYMFLLEHLSTTRVDELSRAQRIFITQINENLSLNIDVADIEHQLATAWIREIILLLGGGIGTYALLRHGVPMAIRQTPRLFRGGASVARKGVNALRSRVSASVEPRAAKAPATPKSIPPEPKNPPSEPKTPPASPKPPMAPKAGVVAPASKIGEELTRVRYATQWERNLAESLEKTRMMQKLRSFQNLKGVKIGGRIIRYGAGVTIPALATAEIISNEKRARGATNNPELQKEHRDNHTTSVLEALGLGLAISSKVPFLKGLVLAERVAWAANYRRKRTAVREDWARETEDFIRDFDAPGLLQEIRTKTLGNTVEGGAGSALYPKAVPSSWRDDETTLKTADEATRGTRWKAYEAYFLQNLPPDLTAAERNVLIKDKAQYIGLLSQKDFNRLSHKELEDADLFAELQQRRRALEAAGMEPVFTYEEDGETKTIDLRKLIPGASTPMEIRKTLGEYATVIKPMEELLTFEALAKAGEPRLIREQLIGKLVHSVHDTERHIREVDWSGVDTWVSSGQSQSENIVRAYIAMQIGKKIDPLSRRLAQGEVSLDDYKKTLEDCHNLMQVLLNAQNTDEYLTKAQKDMGEDRCARAAARKSYHILEFLVSE